MKYLEKIGLNSRKAFNNLKDMLNNTKLINLKTLNKSKFIKFKFLIKYFLLISLNKRLLDLNKVTLFFCLRTRANSKTS